MRYLILCLMLLCNVAQAKTYTVYTDNHVFSPYLAINNLPTTKEQVIKENALFLGDIVEGKNAESKDCSAMKAFYTNLRTIAAGVIVLGNHDGSMIGVDNIIIDKRILITHGDRFLWDRKKSDKFRDEKQCQGSGMIQKALAGRKGNISKSEAKQAAAYAKAFGMKIIMFGHVHVEKTFDQVVDGVRVISFPRGKSTITL